MPNQKPDACRECPLAGDMIGWVADKLDQNARVLTITMFPTQSEASTGNPTTGMAFEEYQRSFHKYADIQMSYANVIRCRGQRGVKLPTGARLSAGVKFCRQYDSVPEATELVVYQGIDVAKHLSPNTNKPMTWRGFLLKGKILEFKRPL